MRRARRYFKTPPVEAATLGLSSLQWDLLEAIAKDQRPADLYGEAYTRSAQAAVCRALRALERRSLLVRSPALALTGLGAEAVREAVSIQTDRDLHHRRARDINRRALTEMLARQQKS